MRSLYVCSSLVGLLLANQVFLQSLAEIASTNEHASYNIARMRIIRTRSTLLMMLEEDGFPYHLAQHIVVLISHLMHDPWVLADLKVIFRFLIATHNASNELKQRCQYGVEKHRNAYFVGITCGSRPTLKTLLRSVSSNPSNDDSDSDGFHSLNSSASSLSFNWELEDAATFSTNEDDGGIGMLNEEPKQPVRDLILTMLLDALGKGATDLVRNFFELCTVEVMLAFLQVEEKSTRLLILRIFEVYLKQPDHAARFKRAAGFQLMGEIIRSFPVTEDILSTLFCIMMGKPVSFNVLKFGSGNSTGVLPYLPSTSLSLVELTLFVFSGFVRLACSPGGRCVHPRCVLQLLDRASYSTQHRQDPS
jgi:hypothetical protein